MSTSNPQASLHASQHCCHTQAFTWSGFEDGTTFLKNLWTDNTTLGGDFATVVYRAQLLGFNAVRLPFRFSDLNMQPKNWTFACKPQSFASIKVWTQSLNRAAFACWGCHGS